MTLAIVITALAVFICGASIGILAVLVAGIRSDDRAQNLTRTPRTRTEAVTRLRAIEHAYQTAIERDATAEPARPLRSPDRAAGREIDLG